MNNLADIYHLDLKVRFEFGRLLKEARPSRLRLHQLVKTFQSERPDLSYADIERRLLSVYALSFDRRTTSTVERVFQTPVYPWLMGQLLLNFSTACISETVQYRSATTLRHMIEGTLDLPMRITEASLLQQVTHRLVTPRHDQISSGIGLDHFIETWAEVCFRRYGDLYGDLFGQLRDLVEQVRGMPLQIHSKAVIATEQELNRLQLSQTDLDWMKAVLMSFTVSERPPTYPLSRGPQTPTVRRIETLIRTLHVIPMTKHEPIRHAVIQTCETLLAAYGQSA